MLCWPGRLLESREAVTALSSQARQTALSADKEHSTGHRVPRISEAAALPSSLR